MIVVGAAARPEDPADWLCRSTRKLFGAVLPSGLWHQFGEVGARILVEFLEAGLAAKFHDGAVVLVYVGLAHVSQFLARYDAHLQGIVIGGGRGCFICILTGIAGIIRTALQATPKKERQASEEKTGDREAGSHAKKIVFFALWRQGLGSDFLSLMLGFPVLPKLIW